MSPSSWKQDPWQRVTHQPTSIKSRREAKPHKGPLHSESSFSPSSQRDSGYTITVTKPDPRRPVGNDDRNPQDPEKQRHDVEAQRTVGDVLFSGFSDELEDLTAEERDTLVRYSFQHAALRARRPVVWIPRDVLGVSDDEIRRCKLMSTVEYADGEGEYDSGNGSGSPGGKSGSDSGGGETKTNIWMSNEGTALDAKGRVVFRRSPPDFASVDLIAL